MSISFFKHNLCNHILDKITNNMHDVMHNYKLNPGSVYHQTIFSVNKNKEFRKTYTNKSAYITYL